MHDDTYLLKKCVFKTVKLQFLMDILQLELVTGTVPWFIDHFLMLMQSFLVSFIIAFVPVWCYLYIYIKEKQVSLTSPFGLKQLEKCLNPAPWPLRLAVNPIRLVLLRHENNCSFSLCKTLPRSDKAQRATVADDGVFLDRAHDSTHDCSLCFTAHLIIITDVIEGLQESLGWSYQLILGEEEASGCWDYSRGMPTVKGNVQ